MSSIRELDAKIGAINAGTSGGPGGGPGGNGINDRHNNRFDPRDRSNQAGQNKVEQYKDLQTASQIYDLTNGSSDGGYSRQRAQMLSEKANMTYEDAKNILYNFYSGNSSLGGSGDYAKMAQKQAAFNIRESDPSTASILTAQANGMSSGDYLAKTQKDYDTAKQAVENLSGQMKALESLGPTTYDSFGGGVQNQGYDKAQLDDLNARLKEAQSKQEQYGKFLEDARGWDTQFRAVSDVNSSAQQHGSYKLALDEANATVAELEAREKELQKIADTGTDIIAGGSLFPGLGISISKENPEESSNRLLSSNELTPAQIQARKELEQVQRDLADARARQKYATSMLTSDPISATAIRLGKENVESYKKVWEGENKQWNAWEREGLASLGDSADAEQYRQTVEWMHDFSNLDWGLPTDKWSKSEQDIFYSIAYHYGVEQALEYGNSLNQSYTEAESTKKTNVVAEWGAGADQEWYGKMYRGIVGAAAQVGLTPVHMVSWFDKMITTAQNQGHYVGRENPWITDYSNALVSGRAGQLNKDYGTLDLGVLGERGFGDAYQVGISVTQSMALGHLTGQEATLLNFFGQAADSGWDEAIQRGANEEQAMLYSVFTGIAETLGEHWSIENLLDDTVDVSTFTKLAKQVFKQGMIEGSEEAFTDVLNLVGDALSAWKSGGQSEMRQMVQQLMANGVSYDEAVRSAWKQFADDVLWDAASGFMSGAVSGGLEHTPTYSRNALYNSISRSSGRKLNAQLNNVTADQLSDLSIEDITLLHSEASRLGNEKAVEMLEAERARRLGAAESKADATSQANASPEAAGTNGKSFGRRLLEEQSAVEPEVDDDIKRLYKWRDERFYDAMKGYGEPKYRQAYEWALWNDDFSRARGIFEEANRRGFDTSEWASGVQAAAPATAQPAQTSSAAESPVSQPTTQTTVSSPSPVAQAAETSSRQNPQPTASAAAESVADESGVPFYFGSEFTERANSTNADYGNGVTAEDIAATNGVEFVQQKLWNGRISNTDAARILNDPALRAAFEDITGESLGGEGTKHDKIEQIKHAARGYYRSLESNVDAVDRATARTRHEERQRQAALEAREEEYRQTVSELEEIDRRKADEKRAKEEAEHQKAADEEAVRNSNYDSYVRGILLNEQNGVSTASAREIASDQRLREAWERVTGKQLPPSFRGAVKMIQQTTRSAQSLGQNQLYEAQTDRASEESEHQEKQRLKDEAKSAADNYVRGLFNSGIFSEEANEILDNRMYREAWERMTGEKIPGGSRADALRSILDYYSTHSEESLSRKASAANDSELYEEGFEEDMAEMRAEQEREYEPEEIEGEDYSLPEGEINQETIDRLISESGAQSTSEIIDTLREAILEDGRILREVERLRENKLVDNRTKLGKALKAIEAEFTENSTSEAEDDTMLTGGQAPAELANSKEANNGRTENVADAEGRGTLPVGEPGYGRSGLREQNAETASEAGQQAEDVSGVQASYQRGTQEIAREGRSKPLAWLGKGKHRTALETGNWTGRVRTVKAGNDAITPFGKAVKPGAPVLLEGTTEIISPDLGTAAHFIRNIFDAFGISRNNSHIYNTDWFGQMGKNGKVTKNGAFGGTSRSGVVAVALNQNGSEARQKRSISDAAHEAGHHRIDLRYRGKSGLGDAYIDKNGKVHLNERTDYTYSAMISTIKDSLGSSDNEAEQLAGSILDFWLDSENGFGYSDVYAENGQTGTIQKIAAQSWNQDALRNAHRSLVSEEFLVEFSAHGDKVQFLVDAGIITQKTALALEDAAISRLQADGIFDQEQVDILHTLRDAVDTFDFLPAVSESVDNGRGYTYTNVSSQEDVAEIESKRPGRSEKAQYFYSAAANTAFANDRDSGNASYNNTGKEKAPRANLAYNSIEEAADSILNKQTIFEGGVEGMPDVVAIDSSGRTYTIPESVRSSVGQVKKALEGIARGSHPLRSLNQLVQLYENFSQDGNEMNGFVNDEIKKTIAEIKELGSGGTFENNRTDNQRLRDLERATTRTVNLIAARMNRVDSAFKKCFEIAQIASESDRSKNRLLGGKLKKQSRAALDAFLSWQTNPTTLFKIAGNFDKASNNAAYKIARQIEHGTGNYQRFYNNAMSHFDDLSKMSGYMDFARGKTTCKVKLGNTTLTEQEAIDFIKRVTTLENTYFGDEARINNIQGFAIERSDGSYSYVDAKTAGKKWTDLRDSMLESLSPVAKAYLEATDSALDYLGERVNATKKKVTGVGFTSTKKGVYYPVEYHAQSKDSKFVDDGVEFLGPTGYGVAQSRTRQDGGYVVVRNASQTVDSYIEKACNYIGYGDVADMLYIMDNPGAGLDSLSNMLGANFGGSYARAMHNYINDINNVKSRQPRASDKILKWGRTHLSSGALRLSLSVPMKQTPSYWTAMGMLSPEAVTKAWRFKALNAKGEGAGNAQVGYRKRGGIEPTVSETLNNKDLLSSLKSRSKIMTAWDNAIVSMDYKTVDNLFSATILDTAMKFPDVDRNSKLFGQLVESKFEEVVLNSQPVYTKNFRAEYARTDDEFIRNASLFRTQQTQNLNQIMTAIGEYRTAKGTLTETIALNRLKATLAGQAASYVEFGILGTLAQLATHRLKGLRKDDDDDSIDPKKLRNRILLNTLESAAGTVWFGDQLAKMAVDGISKASGGDLNEFYGISIGALSTLKSAYDGISRFIENPSFSNGRYAVGYLSQVFGVPLNNAYTAFNSMVMYGADLRYLNDKTKGNRGAYDDVLKMLDDWSKGTLKTNPAKHQADVSFRSGDFGNLLYNISVLETEGKARADREGIDDPHSGHDYLNSLITGKTDAEKKATKAAEEAEYGRALSANERIANYLVDSNLDAEAIDEAVNEYATSGGYNVFYNALRAQGMNPADAVNELYKSDNKTGMTTQIYDEDNVNLLLSGVDAPGDTYDVPPLEQRNLDEYVDYATAAKVYIETKNYDELDKLIDSYNDLDENTRAVLEAKDSNLIHLRECSDLGVGSAEYYGLKDTMKDVQVEMDKSTATGSSLKLIAMGRADLTDKQRAALLDSDWMGISKTGKTVYTTLSKYGMSMEDVGQWLNKADYSWEDSNGTLSNIEVAQALRNTPSLTDGQRRAIYEELKPLLTKPHKINDWGKYTYDSEIAYIDKKGLEVGKWD